MLSLLVAATLTFAAQAAVNIQQVAGWFESGYVTWSAVSGATDYNVYVSPASTESWTQLDKELVRKYPTYYRADAVGLKAGSYKFKVEAVGVSGETAVTDAFTAAAHDRSGFAHVGMDEGIGAYKNDGTLKEGARVIYVYADNFNTVTCDMETDKGVENFTGLQTILNALQKKVSSRTPLAVRIIGTIKYDDTKDSNGNTTLLSGDEGLQVKGSSSDYKGNVTIEGIGDDATIHGFGFLSSKISSVEYRNFAVMICLDDCMSLDTDNKHVWVHNMDFFYGGTGSDKDQAKGDGTVDIKGKSSHCTVSYNHFYDSGKCSLGGMKSETTDCWMTYHHNWFDHSDSRHPRIRTCFYHVYNNYYDGNAKYGVGMTTGGSALVEANYFRNCKYPMLISKQGTDAEGDGTFSGENGGVIKAFNNVMVYPKKVQYYDGSQTDGKWDAVKVDQRDATVSATCLTGGTGYNNAADAAAIAAVPAAKVDDPANVPTIVRGNLGAGRMNHGDFTWTFDNSKQDENYGVIDDLKSALLNYQSTLVGFADGTEISNGGATETVNAGDGKGIDQATNDAYVPSWGSSGGSTGGDTGGGSSTTDQTAVLGSDADYFWCLASNADAVRAKMADGTITLVNGTFQTTSDVRKSDNSVVYSDKVGSLQLNKASGEAIIYNADGISKICYYLARNGSFDGKVLGSEDGTTYTEIQSYSGSAGVKELSITPAANCKYVKITNTSSGSLHIQGLKVYAPVADEREASDLTKVNTQDITLSLKNKETYTLTASTDYTTSSTGAITYASSKTSVATVGTDGTISAVAAGSATITLTQAADDTYKAGSLQFSVVVNDDRDASTLALTSDATVALKMGETEESQISVTGAAGALTYKSSATGVAKVSTSGKITAVAAGTATITVTDAGSDQVKGGSVTVTVNVAEADEEPEPEDPEEPVEEVAVEPVYDEDICHFTSSTPSLSCVSVENVNYSTSKGSKTYAGQTYNCCVKIETDTKVMITPTKDCTIILVFDVAGKKLKIDGTAYKTDSNGEYSFSATGGKTYTLTKGDSMNLFLILFRYGTLGETVAISSAGYATLYLDYPAIIPDGVEAYAPTYDAENSALVLGKALTSESQKVLPKQTAVILKGAAGNYFFGQNKNEASAIESALSGCSADTEVTAEMGTIYTLQMINNQVGFYQFTGETLGKNKAYLALPAGASAPQRIVIGDEAEGLEQIWANDNASTRIYNLQGQVVSDMSRPGIYVVDGKTVIIR